MLSWFDRECQDGRPQSKAKTKRPLRWDSGAAKRRGCVLRKYSDGTGSADLAVAAGYELLGQKPSPAIVETAAKAPILYADSSQGVWGVNQLFFPGR